MSFPKKLTNIYKRLDINKFFKHYNVKYDQYGDELRMRCVLPGHKDSSPSASFNINKGIYNCYVCGGRNFFTLVKELENLKSFNDAVEFVKKMVGYEEEEDNKVNELLEDLHDLQEESDYEEECKFIEIDLKKYLEFESAAKHLSKVKKRVSLNMIQYWNLKYAISGYYQDRLIVPIVVNSKVYSFAARDMSGRANKWLRVLKQAKKDNLTVLELDELREKYECKKIIYPPTIDKKTEKNKNIIFGTSISHLLFNIDNAIKRTTDYVILVEGVFDAMRLFSLGFNVVALLGTKLSNFNRSILLEHFDKIYIALDNDVEEGKKNAGQLSADKLMNDLRNHVEVYNVLLPPNKDPDECDYVEFKSYMDTSEN